MTIAISIFTAFVTCIVLIIAILKKIENNSLSKKLIEQNNNKLIAQNEFNKVQSYLSAYEQENNELHNLQSIFQENKSKIKHLDHAIKIKVPEIDFLEVNNQIKRLQMQLNSLKQEESELYIKTKPIYEKIAEEKKRKENLAEKKRQEDRTNQEDSRNNYYSTNTYSSNSNDSWSGDGGSSSGGGASGDW